LPNPWYIDAEARHQAQTQRLLAYAAIEGKEGVLADDHLAVKDLDTPGAAIQVNPGGYSILARHTGGEYEAYVGKIPEAVQVDVSPTDSSGERTDLVILRVENPYVQGSGSWQQPEDPVDGPYVHVRVIEDVEKNIQTVRAINEDWSAITLARIHRPASTGVVEQSHITDLRSLAQLGGERITIIENPPPDLPPVAQEIYFNIVNETSGGLFDQGDAIDDDHNGWQNWPDDADWNVPVPSWASHMSVIMQLYGIRQEGEGTYGELRVQIDNGTKNTAPVTYDFTTDGQVEGWRRDPMFAVDYLSVPSSLRGRTVRFRSQCQLEDDPGRDGILRWTRGSAALLQVVFHRNPVVG